VSGAIGCLSDVTDQVQLRHELELRASVDTLTSCLNRAATIELLTATLSRHGTSIGGTAVVYIDLDRFKPVNDLHGHAAGDRVLVAAAERLRGAMRGADQLGRLGGDEFLAICPAVDSAAQAMEIAARLADVLDLKVDIGSGSVDVKASVGVAWTMDPIDADSLIAQADSAMYSSKRSGSCRATLFEGADHFKP
jgi:diguanylate cyclase (GGDEF)-like protein